MSFWTVLLIGISLSMDAFAASVANGCRLQQMTTQGVLRPGYWFGGFQALMPVLGWLGGTALRPVVDGVGHWVAFVLLVFVGGKMMFEASRALGRKRAQTTPALDSTHDMLVVALATSIDAFAVGVSFSVLHMSIVWPALLIGSVTFALSAIGTVIGCKAGVFLKGKAEIAGGLVLVCLGVRILLQGLH